MMSVMLMTSVGAWGFDSNWVAHELEHDLKFTFVNSVDHSDAHQLDDFGAPDKEPLSDADHRLLHAAGHVEPFPVPTLDGISAVASGYVQSWFILHTAPTTKSERTFRPPRNASFLI